MAHGRSRARAQGGLHRWPAPSTARSGILAAAAAAAATGQRRMRCVPLDDETN